MKKNADQEYSIESGKGDGLKLLHFRSFLQTPNLVTQWPDRKAMLSTTLESQKRHISVTKRPVNLDTLLISTWGSKDVVEAAGTHPETLFVFAPC